MNQQVGLSVEYVPVEVLETHPRNARLHLSKSLVAESVATHGQYKPLVVQRSTGHILAGNGTFEVLREAGYSEVAVVYVDVDDDQALRILLVDNQTSDEAGYDDAALAVLLRELEADLVGTGWTDQTAGDLLRLFDGALSAVDLARRYGTDPDPSAFWPLIRIKVPPEVEGVWKEWVARYDGVAHDAFVALLVRSRLLKKEVVP